MGIKDHFAGSKIDAIAGVGGDLVKELHNVIIGFFCISRLLLPYLAEGYKDVVVNVPTVEQQRTDNIFHT